MLRMEGKMREAYQVADAAIASLNQITILEEKVELVQGQFEAAYKRLWDLNLKWLSTGTTENSGASGRSKGNQLPQPNPKVSCLKS